MKTCDVDVLLERIREQLQRIDYGKITVEVRADSKTSTIRVETTEKVDKRGR